jgi:hypothetical protein
MDRVLDVAEMDSGVRCGRRVEPAATFIAFRSVRSTAACNWAGAAISEDWLAGWEEGNISRERLRYWQQHDLWVVQTAFQSIRYTIHNQCPS